MKKSFFGLNENIAAALSYVCSFVTGIIALVLERDNKFVRFHAMQSILFGLSVFVIRFVLGILTWIPLLGWIAAIADWLMGIILLAGILYMAYMAYKGREFKLPILGDVAWGQVNR